EHDGFAGLLELGKAQRAPIGCLGLEIGCLLPFLDHARDIMIKIESGDFDEVTPKRPPGARMPDVMYPEEQQQIQTCCQRLAKDSNAKAVLLIAKDGQTIADAGETGHLDVTSLASLTAGNVAATGGISKLLMEKEFTSQYHEGERTHVHISLVHQRAI